MYVSVFVCFFFQYFVFSYNMKPIFNIVKAFFEIVPL